MISICFREDRLGSRMAERKRAQAAKAMEKKTMNPKVIESKYNQICKFQNVKIGHFKVPMTKEQIAVTDWLKKKVNHIIIFVFTLIISIIISIIIIIILVFIFISFALIVVIIIIKSRNQLGRAIK